jgi:(2R)-sulfolactate sulfo-lyase subunit alpha
MASNFKIVFSFILLFFTSGIVIAQCPAGQGLVNINITPDNYPAESSWKLFANNVQIASGTTNDSIICVDTAACIRFEMHDSYGDGICCNYGQGSYTVLWNGIQVANGGQFTNIASHSFNCQPGTICSLPININAGNFTAPNPNTFYEFTPDSSGMYSISTCNLTTCDTKLWIYDQCNNYVFNTDNTGTLFYNDDNPACGVRADIDAFLVAGNTYIIRVGLYGTTSCAGGIPFSITYEGPLVGCMDPTACNYNPDATSAGTCYYYPSPNCPAGPDLTIVQSAIQNSLEIRDEFATNCMVEEGCMNGYGTRTVLAFDTHIKNIGDMDYYIGTPGDNPDQFSFQNCHGHAHYEGYAEYVLYTMNGQNIPIGHKISLNDFKTGDTVMKYGVDIGKVVAPIKKGEHLHVQNVKTKRW